MFWSLTKRGLAEMRLPFLSNSDRRGEGGGVAFWAKSLFWGESSTNAARPPSLGPGASVTGRNTPTPWTWQTVKNKVESLEQRGTITSSKMTKCDCYKTKENKKEQSSSYSWMCVGILGWNTSCIHGWCRNQRVSLRIHGGGTGTKGGADRYAGQTLGGVFYCLTSCWKQS